MIQFGRVLTERSFEVISVILLEFRESILSTCFVIDELTYVTKIFVIEAYNWGMRNHWQSTGLYHSPNGAEV